MFTKALVILLIWIKFDLTNSLPETIRIGKGDVATILIVDESDCVLAPSLNIDVG